jgi:hypothetical protein
LRMEFEKWGVCPTPEPTASKLHRTATEKERSTGPPVS